MRGVSVNIQPGFESNVDFDKKINEYIDKILKLTSRYNLVYDSIDLCGVNVLGEIGKLEDHRSIKFRVSDISGNNKYKTGEKFQKILK